MLLKLGITVFSASGDWPGLVVVMILTGGCSGSHKNTHRDTHRNDIKLDSNHRQPILWFLSLAGSGCKMDQVQLWLQPGKARLGLELGWIKFSHIWDCVSRGLATFGIGQGWFGDGWD